MRCHFEAFGHRLPVERSESVGEGRARVQGWKRLCGSDKVGLELPIETRDASVWAAPEAVRQMQQLWQAAGIAAQWPRDLQRVGFMVP